MASAPPQNPAGEYLAEQGYGRERRQEFIDEIASAPKRLQSALDGLPATGLDAVYRNWSVRQIAHHLADSHLHAYARFKLALTEEGPAIKPYNESAWSALADAVRGDVGPSLALFAGLHGRWVQSLTTMSDADFERTYYHPEMGRDVRLDEALGSYAWHSRHHIAQILWVRENRGLQ